MAVVELEETTNPRMMGLFEQMTKAAERCAEAAAAIQKQAESVAKQTAYTVKQMREIQSIPLNATGWFISQDEIKKLEAAESDFNHFWEELRKEAVSMAQTRRTKAPQAPR